MTNLAFRADSPGVGPNRWIASLSDGSTVFEDRLPNIPSSWIRLQEYVRESGLQITRLRSQANGVMVQLPPFKDENGLQQLDGYWHSKRQTAFLHPDIMQETSHGIGFIRGDTLSISWIKENGSIEEEQRPYNRQKDLAGILNVKISVDHNSNDSARRI